MSFEDGLGISSTKKQHYWPICRSKLLRIQENDRGGTVQILTERNLRALRMTETEDRLMAAAAKIGEIRMPRNG